MTVLLSATAEKIDHVNVMQSLDSSLYQRGNFRKAPCPIRF